MTTKRRLQIADYERCAEAKNLDWLGSKLPVTSNNITTWRCRQCGHVFNSNYQYIARGTRPCAKCRAAQRRLSADDYRSLAERHGLKWIGETLPTGHEIRTEWRCRHGHAWSTTYRSIKEGRACPRCAGLARKTQDDYQAFAARGIFWIGEELPKNVQKPTRWRCEKGHEWTTKYASIYQGSGCPECWNKRRGKTLGRYNEAHYTQLAESRGFIWMEKTLPADSLVPTKWRCQAGHIWKASYSNLRMGRGCPYCSGVARKSESDYHALADQQNIEWLGKDIPKNAASLTTWRCAEGHEFQVSYERLKRMATACPQCRAAKQRSAADYEMLARSCGWRWVGGSIPSNSRTVTNWRCSQGHTLRMSYTWVARQKGACPVCSGRRKPIAIQRAK